MAKRGGFPGGMPGNMNNLMKQAQRMQRQMEETTKELEEKEYTAAAGGGDAMLLLLPLLQWAAICAKHVIPVSVIGALLLSVLTLHVVLILKSHIKG